jgi:phenylacetate-CoA ligase
MQTIFWSDIESLSRTELKDLQLRQLKEQVQYLNTHSPYYKRIFKENKIAPEDIKSLDDLKKIPFVDKYMVGESQERSPWFGEFLCVPEADIVRYFRTSGTTLKPRNFAYTYHDWWDISVEVLARMMYSVDITADDRAFIAFPYSTFINLWTGHYACEKLGCMIIPGGGISTKERLKLMQDMQVTVLCATPTYANHLANVAAEIDLDIRSIPMRVIHMGGEPLAAVPGSRKRLEEVWQAKAYDQYGASESLAIVAGECKEQSGLHMVEDVFIPEIIDDKGEQVPPGRTGELVFSNTLSKTMPILRFKTGDVVTYTDEPCPCGQETIRIKVLGRKDDMLVIKGTNVFPSHVEEMVKRCPELSSEFMIVIDEIDGNYELVIQVEPNKCECFTPEEETQVTVKLVEMMRENLRLRPVIQVMEPNSLPRFEVKAKRVIDKRKKG